MTDKQRVVKAVEGLPDDATVEDAIERLCFIAKVNKGVRELDGGLGVPHEEAKRRILGG
jgi:predicted transcriptional regulator